MKGGTHFKKAQSFGLGDALDGNAGHHCDNFGHAVIVDSDAVLFEAFLPAAFGFVEF